MFKAKSKDTTATPLKFFVAKFEHILHVVLYFYAKFERIIAGCEKVLFQK